MTMMKLLLLLSFYGSIVGGILLVAGLYSVLWGKSKETNIDPCREVTKISDPQDHVEIS